MICLRNISIDTLHKGDTDDDDDDDDDDDNGALGRHKNSLVALSALRDHCSIKPLTL